MGVIGVQQRKEPLVLPEELSAIPKIGSEVHAWDQFVCNTPGGSHLQSSLWAQVKSSLGWDSVRVTLEDNNKILAGAQLLTRKVPLGLKICYVPRGPVVLQGYEHLDNQLLEKILQVACEQRYCYLVIQPPKRGEHFISNMTNKGFQCCALELAPTATILIPLSPSEDEILGQMKRQTRQNIRKSLRAGVVTRTGGQGDIPAFYDLHVQTSQRQKFLPYQEKYLRQMWQSFNHIGEIQFIFSEFDHEIVSGLLLVGFGDTVCAKLLGWSGRFGEHRPNDAIFWAAIQWSRSKGYRYFDFEGVSREGAIAVTSGDELPKHLHRSPDFLKYGFGGEVTLLPEAYAFILNPFFRMILGNFDFKVGDQSLTSKMVDLIRKR